MKNKKELKKMGIIVAVVSLLMLVSFSVITFQKSKENVNIEVENKKKDEIIFNNQSDLDEKEIRLLVEEKRNNLKNFFKNAQYYSISEVAKGYSKEDDDTYIVIDEEFLNKLKSMVSLDIYGEYWKEMKEVIPYENVLLKSRIYRAPKNLFDDLYLKSAIAMQEVSEELLLLKSATNNKIEAIENIRLCEEVDFCKREEYYEFILEKEESEWIITEFTKKLNLNLEK